MLYVYVMTPWKGGVVAASTPGLADVHNGVVEEPEAEHKGRVSCAAHEHERGAEQPGDGERVERAVEGGGGGVARHEPEESGRLEEQVPALAQPAPEPERPPRVRRGVDVDNGAAGMSPDALQKVTCGGQPIAPD